MVLRCTPFYILLDFAWFCSQVQAPPSKSKRKIILSGAFIPWRMAIFIPTLMCLPILALVTILHESPDWLLRRGRIEEYNKSMNFYQKSKVLYHCQGITGCPKNEEGNSACKRTFFWDTWYIVHCMLHNNVVLVLNIIIYTIEYLQFVLLKTKFILED